MEVQIPFVNFYANGKSSHKQAIRERIASEIVNVSKVSWVPGPSSYFLTCSVEQCPWEMENPTNGFCFCFCFVFPFMKNADKKVIGLKINLSL